MLRKETRHVLFQLWIFDSSPIIGFDFSRASLGHFPALQESRFVFSGDENLLCCWSFVLNMTASHPGGNVLSAVRMWNSSFIFLLVTHTSSWAAWVKHKLFSELLSVLPLITLRKREKCAPLTLLLKICYLPVISGQWLFCMYGLQNVYMLSLTAMKDCWNKLYSHGGTTWALLLVFFFWVLSGSWSLHLLVSVCEGQTGHRGEWEPKQEKAGRQTKDTNMISDCLGSVTGLNFTCSYFYVIHKKEFRARSIKLNARFF